MGSKYFNNELTSYRRDNFSSHMSECVQDLWKTRRFSDATLICCRRKAFEHSRQSYKHLKVHKFVLSSWSPYFNDLFINLGESSNPIVMVPEILAEDLEPILEFLYTGVVRIGKEATEGFLNAGKILQIWDKVSDQSERDPLASSPNRSTLETSFDFTNDSKRSRRETSVSDEVGDNDDDGMDLDNQELLSCVDVTLGSTPGSPSIKLESTASTSAEEKAEPLETGVLTPLNYQEVLNLFSSTDLDICDGDALRPVNPKLGEIYLFFFRDQETMRYLRKDGFKWLNNSGSKKLHTDMKIRKTSFSPVDSKLKSVSMMKYEFSSELAGKVLIHYAQRLCH